MLGVAVSTAVPGVGGICPFVKPGVGAVATQSWVNPYLGIDGLKLLEQGKHSPASARYADRRRPRPRRPAARDCGRERAAAPPGAAASAPTGSDTLPDQTSRCRETCWSASVRFRRWRKPSQAPPASRFRSASWPCSKAGQSAGGDKRGRQSAAMLVYRIEEFPYLSLAGRRARTSRGGIASSVRSRAPSATPVCRRDAVSPKSAWAIFRSP